MIGFTLWPLVQMELVRRFEVSPWKLAGWGMYATPRIAPGIAILVQRGAEPPAPMAVVPSQVRVACENFAPRRLWLRDLAPPDRIGQLVLAASPDYRTAIVRIIQPVLDTETGMVRTDLKDYRYSVSRDAPY
jgi:hypothetical protein